MVFLSAHTSLQLESPETESITRADNKLDDWFGRGDCRQSSVIWSSHLDVFEQPNTGTAEWKLIGNTLAVCDSSGMGSKRNILNPFGFLRKVVLLKKEAMKY